MWKQSHLHRNREHWNPCRMLILTFIIVFWMLITWFKFQLLRQTTRWWCLCTIGANDEVGVKHSLRCFVSKSQCSKVFAYKMFSKVNAIIFHTSKQSVPMKMQAIHAVWTRVCVSFSIGLFWCEFGDEYVSSWIA